MNKGFEIGRVTGTFRLEVNGKNPPIRPIQSVKSTLILFRKFAFGAELHAGRRTDTDVNHGRQAVRVIIGPNRRARAPPGFAGADTMIDACGPVPRQSPIPFHITVESEYFAFRTEIEIIRVSEAGEDQFPFSPFRIS